MPPPAQDVLFQDALRRDLTTARRAALLDLLWHERFLTRAQLIARVELKLGRDCFGKSAWEDNFYRDMRVVKQAFHAAGFHLAFSRGERRAGYYLLDQPPLSPELSQIDPKRLRRGGYPPDRNLPPPLAGQPLPPGLRHQRRRPPRGGLPHPPGEPRAQPGGGQPHGLAASLRAMNARPLDIVDFLGLVLDALDSAGVAYLIGGAIAGWAWGEPRATQDLDLVVDIPVEAVNRLSDELKARDMLVPAEIILDALTEDRADVPINAIHLYSGLKADLYPLRAGDELRQEAFQRRLQVDFGPPIGNVYVHSPEDLILYKLLFFSINRQPKHVRDITSILRAKQGQLDMALLLRWVERLGLSRIWEEVNE